MKSPWKTPARKLKRQRRERVRRGAAEPDRLTEVERTRRTFLNGGLHLSRRHTCLSVSFSGVGLELGLAEAVRRARGVRDGDCGRRGSERQQRLSFDKEMAIETTHLRCRPKPS